MPGSPHSKLAAVLAADLVGYSRLMEADEAGTLAALQNCRRNYWTPAIERHAGRLVGTAGDSMLVEFASTVAAVECAVTLQRGMEERNGAHPDAPAMQLRIGINIGEVIADGNDIYGDGVNVAARLEANATPGGIHLSQAAFDQARGRIDLDFEPLGEATLKNISRPVAVYAVTLGDKAARLAEQSAAIAGSAVPGSQPALPKRPSIAILAFENMSGDPEQEFFSDGIAEDLTVSLSRFHNLFVISRNTAFTFKGRAVDVRQVSRDLGVQYVLNGSVRKAGERVRITAQLIDAVNDNHVWAERYDRRLDAIFDIQDEITESIVGAVEPVLEAAMARHARRKHVPGLEGWELAARAMWHVAKYTETDSAAAEALFLAALDKEPDNSDFMARLGISYVLDAIYAWHRPQLESLQMGMAQAQAAIDHDDGNALGHAVLGAALYNLRRHADAVHSLEKAVDLNPNSSVAIGVLGIVHTYMHEFEAAEFELNRAIRLSPRDPLKSLYINHLGAAPFMQGRYDEAAHWFEKALLENPTQPTSLRSLASALGMLGEIEEARRVYERLKKVLPGVTLAVTRSGVGFAFEDDIDRFVEGLRRAGMPEG